MRFVKKFFGVLLCICAVGFLSAAAQVDPGMRAYFIVLTCICIAGAVLLFVKSKRKRAANPETHTTSVQGDLATVQTEYTPSDVPADIAKEMRKYYTFAQAKRDAEIMAESFKIAGSTANLDTFCMRYDLAMKKAHTLLQAEQVNVRGMKKLKCHNACLSVINAGTSVRSLALENYAQHEFGEVDQLKTAKGKYNRYAKMLAALEKAEPTFMFMEEYDALLTDVKDRMEQLGITV